MFDVGPDYLEKLLRDVKSEHAGRSQGSNNSSSRFDWSVLEQKQNHIDYQLNQYLNSIRAHVSKHRRAQKKSRKHVRSLLEVIRTYEELSIAAEGGPQSQSPRALQVRYDALQDDDNDDDDDGSSDRRRIRAHWDKHAYKMEQKNTRSSGDRQWPNARHPHHSDEDLEDPVHQNFHYTYSQENHTATAARKGEHQNEVQNDTSTHRNGVGQGQGESSCDHPTSAPSAPPHRHQRHQERDPVHSSAPGTLSPARQRPSGPRFRSQSPPPPHSPPHSSRTHSSRTHSGRTLSLLEQLQREMERELQQQRG